MPLPPSPDPYTPWIWPYPPYRPGICPPWPGPQGPVPQAGDPARAGVTHFVRYLIIPPVGTLFAPAHFRPGPLFAPGTLSWPPRIQDIARIYTPPGDPVPHIPPGYAPIPPWIPPWGPPYPIYPPGYAPIPPWIPPWGPPYPIYPPDMVSKWGSYWGGFAHHRDAGFDVALRKIGHLGPVFLGIWGVSLSPWCSP